jgi:hypothetical protein
MIHLLSLALPLAKINKRKKRENVREVIQG